MCRHQARKAVPGAGGVMPDADEDTLSKVVLPPAGSAFWIKVQLPRGTVAPWLPLGHRSVGGVRTRDKRRCRVEGCERQLCEPTEMRSGACREHVKGVVYVVWPTEHDPKCYCQGCGLWRAAEPWPRDIAGSRLSRCRRCFKGTLASPVVASNPVTAPALATVTDVIDRRSGTREPVIEHDPDALKHEDGLPLMCWQPKISRRDAEDATVYMCRIRGCEVLAPKKFLCVPHRLLVVHEEVAAGECAHQRYCFGCRVMRNAYVFTPFGSCGSAKCRRLTSKAGTWSTEHLINGVYPGVAWPQCKGSPTYEDCCAVAVKMGVPLLHRRDQGDNMCGHHVLGQARCKAVCSIGHRVCPHHMGKVGVCTATAGMVWTCPRCCCVKPLEARGEGVCRACYDDPVTGVGPGRNISSDADCVMVVQRGCDGSDGAAVARPSTSIAAAAPVVAAAGSDIVAFGDSDSECDACDDINTAFDAGIVTFGDSDSDSDPDTERDAVAKESEVAIQFRIGGSRPKRLPVQLPIDGHTCNAPQCVKPLSAADGHGGRCFVCTVVATQFGSPIDLIPLLIEPGTLQGGQGV